MRLQEPKQDSVFLNPVLSQKTNKNRFPLVVALTVVLFVAFFSAGIVTALFAASPSMVQVQGCVNCGTITYSQDVTTGNLLVFAFNQVGGTSCDSSGTLTDSLGNSFFKLYGIGNPGYANDVVCVYYVTSAFTGADTITLQATENTAIAFELNGFTINASQVVGGGGSHTGAQTAQTWNYHASTSLSMGVLTVELATSATENNTGYYQGYLTPTNGFTIEAQVNGGTTNPVALAAYALGIGGNNQNFPMSYVQTQTQTTGNTGAFFDVVGFSIVGLTPYNPYSTSTHVYTITSTVSWCYTSQAGNCVNETYTSTESYDATYTVLTLTSCSINDSGSPNCVTKTGSENVTVTYTASSVIIVTSTTTTTATAVLAPTTSSINYWIFGFIVLMIPPATLIGIGEERKKASGQTLEPTIEIVPLLLIGLVVGSLLGLILNVLPWEFLLIFIVITGLWFFKDRL